MSGKPPAQPKGGAKKEITIILVDDIPEVRENIKKLLAFEPDLKVIGTAGTGIEGVQLATELQPDVIIMDINMPDMDGLEATEIISKDVPTSAVIIMSVQDDMDYMRQAMMAGAMNFLTKPVKMDMLYDAVRTVYAKNKPARDLAAAMANRPVIVEKSSGEIEGDRAGNIIVVYSPQGGAGTTTICTNLASGLMQEGTKVLLVDADLQFADVGTFLNIQAPTTIVELAEDVADMDVELFENIVMTHDSGLKVLAGPGRPEFADEVTADPSTVATILDKISSSYDFIIVDTSSALSETLLNIFDRATKILLVGTPTLVSIKNQRFVLDLFDQLDYEPSKVWLAVNRIWDERKGKSVTISAERIESYLKRQVIGKIPLVDERVILSAINKGMPVIAADRDQNKPPTKQLLEMASFIYSELVEEEEEEEVMERNPRSRKDKKGRFSR
jgi:pilus assembly protein CpaE